MTRGDGVLMAVSRGALAATIVALGSTSALAFQEIVVTEEANETILFQADAVLREVADGPVIATGNVRASYGGRLLTAERVIYDPATEIVTATGDVAIYEEDGQIYFADTVQLTGDLQAGVARNFGILLADSSRLAGSTAVTREEEGRRELNNAVFTACDVCAEDGSKKRPTWQVKALRVVQDEEDQVIRFRNAFIEVLGVPVIYTPYIQVPDPSVDRKSGFLTPNVGISSRIGFEVEIPYYQVISAHQDFTIAPRHMTELGTLIKGEYRVRTHDAGAVVQTGFIQPTDEETKAREDLPNTRWHFFGSAFKDLDDDWRAEIEINTVSDDTYLQFYDVQQEGQLQDVLDVIKPDRLTSELAFTRRRPNSFTDISAISFQTLRAVDEDDSQANALPRLTHRRDFRVPGIGGELSVLGNFLYLNRVTGLDTTRAILSSTYEREYTTRNGHRFQAFAELRGDVYHYEEATEGIESCRPRSAADDAPLLDIRRRPCADNLPRDGQDAEWVTARALPTIGAEWSYPLAKITDRATFIIEPRLQLAISPDRDFTNDVFNEDSQFFQFDGITLFDWSKSTGFDQWEDGRRLNAGLSGTAAYNNGLTISGLIGQQFRAEETTAFDPDSGLGDTVSDLVGQLDIRFGRTFSFDNRFRFDKDDFTLDRSENTLIANIGPVRGAFSYLRVETQELEAAGRRDEFLTSAVQYRITDSWAVGANWRENLASGDTTQQTLRLSYRDSCTIFSLNYAFDNTVGRGFDANRSLTFNIDLVGF